MRAGAVIRLGLLLASLAALGVRAPAAHAYVYWTNFTGTSIGRAGSDGSAPDQHFLAAGTGPAGLAVDDGNLSWTNPSAGTISTTSGAATITGASSPHGVAPDQAYWANFTSNTIGSPASQSFITGASGPDGMTRQRNTLYWANFSNGTIARADLSTSPPTVLENLVTGASGPAGVAVDQHHVYWTNFNGTTIGRANLDGSGINQSFITGANHPQSVVVDAGHVYWTNYGAGAAGAGTIGRANLDGTGVDQSFITGATGPDGLAVDDLPLPEGVLTATAPTHSLGGWPASETDQLFPDVTGAVGPADYLLIAFDSYQVLAKQPPLRVERSGTIASLWNSYVGTNPGNECGQRHEQIHPQVHYDRAAERWVISATFVASDGDTYVCFAVSKSPDPAGQYALYDFLLGDRARGGRLGVWSDAYYLAGSTAAGQRQACAFDRTRMLAAAPATMQCLDIPGDTADEAVPADDDSDLPPPTGEPERLVAADPATSMLQIWTFHPDWTDPERSSISAPTLTAVDPFAICPPGCDSPALAHPGPVSYRNLGDHESLLFSDPVDTGPTTGIRWYELGTHGDAISVVQQATYAPNDSTSEFAPALAEDQAGDIGLTLRDGTETGYTGRLADDPLSTLLQGARSVTNSNADNEIVDAPAFAPIGSLQVDPADGCHFWVLGESLQQSGLGGDPTVAVKSFSFPSCGAADFALDESPGTLSAVQGATATTTVHGVTTRGPDQALALWASGLPAGATVAFAPTSIRSGGSSSATFTTTAATPPGVYAITVGARQSLSGATHALALTLTVTAPMCPAGQTGTPPACSEPASVPRPDPAPPALTTLPVLGSPTAIATATGAPTPGPAKTAKTAALGLPAARACVSRRSFSIHLVKSFVAKAKAIQIRVTGRSATTKTGRSITQAIDLRGLPKGSVTVTITLTERSGAKLTQSRTYRTCATKRHS